MTTEERQTRSERATKISEEDDKVIGRNLAL